MDVDRFETLAQAYGGDPGRWPEAERAAAEAFRFASPAEAERVLAEAADLDFALDAWRVSAPSAALRGRVLAAAPSPRPRRRSLGLWLSGAGFAAAAAVAGVMVGVAASNAAVSDIRADALLSATLPQEGAALAAFTLGAAGGAEA